MKLTKSEEIVYGLIPHGYNNAISSKKISNLTGIPRRQVRAKIERLVLEFHLPIGSSSSKGSGYFKIVTEEDLEIAQRHLKPRAIKIFKRYRALQKLSKKFSDQIGLDEMII